MRDLEKLVELGREFAKPWKQATKVLAVLLVFGNYWFVMFGL